MSLKDTIEVDMTKLRASIAKPCDEKYARKLLQDYLKNMPGYVHGGWEVVKDFRRWDDQSRYNFTVHNSITGLSYYKIESQVEDETMDEYYDRKRSERQKASL